MFKPFFKFLIAELKFLKKYLNKNLKKDLLKNYNFQLHHQSYLYLNLMIKKTLSAPALIIKN